jgi:hypothetical protein
MFVIPELRMLRQEDEVEATLGLVVRCSLKTTIKPNKKECLSLHLLSGPSEFAILYMFL